MTMESQFCPECGTEMNAEGHCPNCLYGLSCDRCCYYTRCRPFNTSQACDDYDNPNAPFALIDGEVEDDRF